MLCSHTISGVNACKERADLEVRVQKLRGSCRQLCFPDWESGDASGFGGGADRDAPLRMLIFGASPKNLGRESERKMIRRTAVDIVRGMETLGFRRMGNCIVLSADRYTRL